MSQFMFFLETAEPKNNGLVTMFMLYAVVLVFFWFFFLRPQRKKQKRVQEMQSSIDVGESVLTAGGLYGKVVDCVNDIVIVEFGTNKSVRIPIKRSSIISVSEPDLTVYSDDEEVE